jgi:hypothetical protein
MWPSMGVVPSEARDGGDAERPCRTRSHATGGETLRVKPEVSPAREVPSPFAATPTASCAHPAQASALVVIALVATVALGAMLRAFLAGSAWLPGGFGELRHAHTHLGWYGVVVASTAAAWARLPGGEALVAGRVARAAYAAAVVVAGVGFFGWGYGVAAIVASTIVLAFWLVWTWQLWRAGLARGAFAAAPVGMIAAAALIPLVAIHARRDHALAQALVAGFLAALLFCVALPAALSRAGLRAPPAAWYVVCSLGAALYLGPLQLTAAMAVFPLGLGALLLRAALGPGRLDVRALLALVAAALLLHALGLLPWTRPVAVAAVHFAVLGPVLHGLLLGDAGSGLARSLRWSHHALLAVMCVCIARPEVAGAAVAAAITGGLLALGWSLWALRALVVRADDAGAHGAPVSM